MGTYGTTLLRVEEYLKKGFQMKYVGIRKWFFLEWVLQIYRMTLAIATNVEFNKLVTEVIGSVLYLSRN